MPGMSDLPTDPQPERPEPPAGPRKLTRSTQDRVVGGVAGGLGRYFNVDPLAFRIGFVLLSFAGAFGLLAYLVCLAFIPTDDPDAPPRTGLLRFAGFALLAGAVLFVFAPHWFWGPEIPALAVAALVIFMLVRAIREGDGGRPAARAAAKVALGVALAALAAAGFVGAAAGTALGGGILVAGLVIACGVALVGGAFRGGARWLVLPALVLAIPLGVVAASDLDLSGSWGERTFRPAGAAELAGGYEMGAGRMTVDLRGVKFPPGRTDLPLDLGVGEVQVIVPRDLCVTTDSHVGVGAIDVGDGGQGGVDFDVDDRQAVAPGTAQLRVVGDVGIGALRIGDRWTRAGRGPHGFRELELTRTGTNRLACEAA
jgi:phage shock protein PspC (stress-responsive transcriptional regulator)